MTDYDNTNRGALWPKKPNASEGAPDYKAEFNFEGTDYSIAFWKRKPHENPARPPWSFKIENKSEQHQQGMASAQAAVDGGIEDSEIPF